MANLIKFTVRIGANFSPRDGEPERYPDGNLNYKIQNQESSLPILSNYNLREQGDNLTDYQYIEKRVKGITQCFKSG